MPVTTTRPFVSLIRRCAARNDSPRRSLSARTASASMSRTSRASASSRSASESACGCSRFVIDEIIDPGVPLVGAWNVTDALTVALILLASAVAVVVVFRLLGMPAILGYLVVGALIGPNALGLVADTEDKRSLAEFGVV